MSSSSTKRHKYHKVQSAQTLPDSSPETHQKNKTIFTGFQNLLTSLSRPSINLEDANDSSFEKKNEYATSKARELKYNLQEWILMKSIVFSLVVFLVFVSLIHFLLNLAGSYLPVLILSLLTSIALRPTKDHFSFNIKKFFGLIHVQQQEKYFFKDSLIFFLWRTLNDLVHYKQNTQLTRKRRQRIAGFFKAFNPTGDIYAIITACVCWIIITRFGINIVLYILGILVILDFFIRLFLDFLVFLIDQFSWSRDIKLRIQKNKNFGLIIDSTVGTAVLLLFLILSIGSVIFVIFFLLSDIETIIINLRGAITLLIQNINKRVVQYSGIENAIDENFVISLMKTYNESINSFVEKHDLKGLYALFSGVLNSFRSDPSSSDSIKDFPGLVENQSQFEQCMIENRLNFNFSIARNLEALYCSILPYAKKLTVDPLTTVKKIQDGVSFVVQLLFGTILMEVFLISKAALDYMFNFVVFCFCVYYLLHANRSAINTVTSLLPFSPNVQTELNTSLVKSIKGSFLCSIKIFFYHFFFTWLIFDIFHLKLGFTISIAASVFSIIPFIPSWCFCLPHAIYFYIGENNLLSALVFPIAYLMVSNKVYNDIYRKSIDVHPYLTGLSIVMGIYAFDVQGIIYGPLLMCLIMIVIELVKKYGVSTTSMLQFYRKKVYLEQLDSLDKMAQNKEEKRRSRSFDSDRTPLSPHRPERF